ncbi:MAG: aminomethyl-transferring glycine dehydrogenase, partial [Burkholderiales bacterium]|nr:aminomethyl-transferring glycine dehydrogenase [Burkholderiales bacterium]
MPDTPISSAARASLDELEDHDAFARRHIGPDLAEQEAMLGTLGFASRAALIDAVVPEAIRRRKPMGIGAPRSEGEALNALRAIAEKNLVFRSYIGQGYYETYTPGVILRNVFQNPAWYTAYTPYQPEISQGRLEALINFQTMVADLTGMDIANASMLDEATAAAEAMTLCLRATRSASRLFAVAEDVLPQTIDVVRVRAEPLGIEVRVASHVELAGLDAFGALVQYPGVDGEIRDHAPLAKALHERGGYLVAAADLLALTILKPPGEWGADVAVGNTQRFGVPMGFGGPHAGYMATRDELKRSMPGRLVGVTVDAQGEPAYRLALQTREQHIRREKATSNICTAQVLLAVMASMYAVYHGPEGLKRIARRVHRLTAMLRSGLEKLDFAVAPGHFFDTLTVDTRGKAPGILERGRAARMNFRLAGAGRLGISLDETTTREHVDAILAVFGGDPAAARIGKLDESADAIPGDLARTSDFLTHPVFNRYHSETEMLRYLRSLADKDVALDRSMIPLGSCTMKLNATSEMIPVSWREFAHIHPFAPPEQWRGYRSLIEGLEERLAKATGYAAVSIQPNAGSQGEYAGLLIIRRWHESRGEGHRNVCLIPSSAHGTNPASAQMAGMRVVVVGCDPAGNVDLADLERKAAEHAANLAAIMVTYPSTHGVFEAGIVRLCEIVHRYGGQVYVDGANMNAMVGLCAPGEFGGDVSHLNLHKTFCIPHGGGGPGVGPIGVAEHLVPFLPGHAVVNLGGEEPIGAVSA